MMRSHHHSAASFVSERRMIAKNPDIPKGIQNVPDQQLSELERRVTSSNLPPEMKKEIIARLNSTRDTVIKKPNSDKAMDSIGKVIPKEDPRYRAAYERLSGPRNTRGLIDYLPKYHIDQVGNVVPKKIPSGATVYGLEEGVVRERYDAKLGRIKFIMENGQWTYGGVVATPDQLRSDTLKLQEADAARKAAKLRHEQMLSYYLARARQGEPIPARQNMEADYAKVRYYEDLGRGRIQTDPNYNPNWTDRYKVAGQMRNSPSEIQQRKQQRDKAMAEFNARWDKIEIRQKALRCMEFLANSGNKGQFVQLPDGLGKNKQGIQFVYRNNKGVMEAYANGNGVWSYDGKEGAWVRTGDLPDDLGVEKAEPIAKAVPKNPNESVPKSANTQEAAKPTFTPEQVNAAKKAGESIRAFFRSIRPSQAASNQPAPTPVPNVEAPVAAAPKQAPSAPSEKPAGTLPAESGTNPERIAEIGSEQKSAADVIVDKNAKTEDRIQAMRSLIRNLKQNGLYLKTRELIALGQSQTATDKASVNKVLESVSDELDTVLETLIEKESKARLASVRNSLQKFSTEKTKEYATAVVMNMHDLVQFSIELENEKVIATQEEMNDYMAKFDKDEMLSRFHAMDEAKLQGLKSGDIDALLREIDGLLKAKA